MENAETVFMLTIPAEIPAELAAKAEAIKNNLFYDKPYAEMYRNLIQIGMDEIRGKAVKEKQCEKVSENRLSVTGGENLLNKPTI